MAGKSLSNAYHDTDRTRHLGAWLEALGLTSNVILVLHDRGSALEFNHTARFAEQIKSIASQDQPMRASAWVRSATMSSTCSMPMEARMVASEMPRRSRVSRGTPECTVVAGWQTKDSVPPRLTASLKTCSALSTAKAPASPPSTSNEKVLPAPVQLAAKERVRGVRFGKQGGIVDAGDIGVSDEEAGDNLGAAAGGVHAQGQGLKRARQHPGGVWIELRADGAAQLSDRLQQSVSA